MVYCLACGSRDVECVRCRFGLSHDEIEWGGEVIEAERKVLAATTAMERATALDALVDAIDGKEASVRA